MVLGYLKEQIENPINVCIKWQIQSYFLDTPLWKHRFRILTRFLKQKLGIEKCHYVPDFLMLKMMYKWTQDFEQNRNSFEVKLKIYNEKVIRLSSNNSLDFT
jgi:adenylate kinase family enzyme